MFREMPLIFAVTNPNSLKKLSCFSSISSRMISLNTTIRSSLLFKDQLPVHKFKTILTAEILELRVKAIIIANLHILDCSGNFRYQNI